MKSIEEAKESDYDFYRPIKEKYAPGKLIVSIIIDVYYGLDLLAQAVQSVLDQDYVNVELILINNGADVDITAYMQDVYNKNSNTSLIHFKKNQFTWDDNQKYMAVCWNSGLLNCKGDIIGHLSYDDLLSENCCSSMAKLFTENDNCVTAGPLPVSIDINGDINKSMTNLLKDKNKRDRYIDGKELAIDFITGSHNKFFGAPGGILFTKKDLLIQCGGYDRSWDSTQIIKLAIYGDCGFDPTAKLYWRHHSGQLNKMGKARGVTWCHVLQKTVNSELIIDSWVKMFSSDDVRLLKRYIAITPRNESVDIAMGYIRGKDFKSYFSNLYNLYHKCPSNLFYVITYSPIEVIKMIKQKIKEFYRAYE